MELASRVGSVVAVDLDADMVAEGRRLAEAAAVGNIEWVTAAAEGVDYPEGSFRLIVIASAFHRMHRPVVATRCRSMLDRDGLLAVLGNPTPLMQIRDRTPIGAPIRTVQDRWFSEDYYVLDVARLDPPEVVLTDCGFAEVEVSYAAQVQEWTVERFLGFLRSTSSRPDQRLGAVFHTFAAELEDAIRAVEPSGRWVLDTPIQVITARPYAGVRGGVVDPVSVVDAVDLAEPDVLDGGQVVAGDVMEDDRDLAAEVVEVDGGAGVPEDPA